MSQYEVTFAGFGGQGIMTAGQLLAYAGIEEEKQVAWIPSYGPEMRGGTAYCTVVISDIRIGSPIISSPQCACVFNRPSFDKFTPRIKPGGLVIINSTLINVTTDRQDIEVRIDGLPNKTMARISPGMTQYEATSVNRSSAGVEGALRTT